MDPYIDERLVIQTSEPAQRNGGVDPFAPQRDDRLPVMEYRGHRRRWLRCVAYHEAGHAVVAWALGSKFEEVTIVPDRSIYGPSAGHVGGVPEPSRVRPEPEAVEAYITVGMGGHAAMGIVFLGVWGDGGSYVDQLRADRWARRISATDEERAACLERAREKARAIVLRHRAGLEALAEALWNLKRLDSADVRQILSHWARRNGMPSRS